MTSDGLAAIRVGTGNRVLMLHGVGLRAEAWSAQFEALSREYALFAPDLPGHGETAMPINGANLADFADQIAAAIDAPCFVVGHSLGAMIALDLAVRYADKIRAVVALNAVFRRDAAAKSAVQDRAVALGTESAPNPAPTLRRWFGPNISPERTACREWLTSVRQPGYRAAYSIFANNDGPSDAALSDLACPALFLTGEADPNSTPAMSHAMAGLAPNGRAQIVEGAAHMLPMTHADQVNTALLSFFRDVSR
ncbi:MAG: alpha/beta fold hydrolase [Boseongicola sp.]